MANVNTVVKLKGAAMTDRRIVVEMTPKEAKSILKSLDLAYRTSDRPVRTPLRRELRNAVL